MGELVEDWLEATRPTVRDATHYSYARNFALHVLPALGSTPVVAVNAGTLNTLDAQLIATGNRTNRPGAAAGLSPRTVRYVHTITHRMFKDAVRWGRLARNPADAADPPKATASGRPDMVTWTAEEVRVFLDGVRENRL